MIPYNSCFIDQFPCHVFRCQLKALNPRQGIFNLFFQVFLVIGELAAKVGTDLFCLLRILHQLHAAEDDDAVDVERPLAFLAIALVIDAVADLVAGPDGIELVALLGAVEVELAILLTVPVVHGHAIGIALLPKN